MQNCPSSFSVETEKLLLIFTFPALLGSFSDTVEYQTDDDDNGTQKTDYDNLQISWRTFYRSEWAVFIVM